MDNAQSDKKGEREYGKERGRVKGTQKCSLHAGSAVNRECAAKKLHGGVKGRQSVGQDVGNELSAFAIVSSRREIDKDSSVDVATWLRLMVAV